MAQPTRNLNKILLKDSPGGHYEEGIAGAEIYPGEAIRLASDGLYYPEPLAAQIAAGRGLKIAVEAVTPGDIYNGSTNRGLVTSAYAIGDLVFFYTPLPGDHFNARVKTGENISIADYLSAEGSGSGKFVEVSSSATAPYPVDLTRLRVHDALQTNLPGTAANDDMGLITGTPGTAKPVLQGVDFGGTSTDEKGTFKLILPPEYRAGSAITIRVNAGMVTTVSDGTATVDVEAYKETAGAAVVGSDICATAAQSINSLTAANKDFTITPTGLVPGDCLQIRLAFAGSDSGNVGVMIPQINDVTVLIGNAVGGQVEALESSGGALAAAGLIRVRVLGT